MRLWKVTRKGTEEVLFVLADRWFDVRAFSVTVLPVGGDPGQVLVEPAAPFPKGTKKLKVPAYRLEWRGHAASNPSTLHMVPIQCKTVQELYGTTP